MAKAVADKALAYASLYIPFATDGHRGYRLVSQLPLFVSRWQGATSTQAPSLAMGSLTSRLDERGVDAGNSITNS
jgi:hypothetical protein